MPKVDDNDREVLANFNAAANGLLTTRFLICLNTQFALSVYSNQSTANNYT